MGLIVLEDNQMNTMARTDVSLFGTQGRKYHILPFITTDYVVFQLDFLSLAI